jgi:hypothetical protein
MTTLLVAGERELQKSKTFFPSESFSVKLKLDSEGELDG